MGNTQNKTQPTNQDVLAFLAAVPDEEKRRDSQKLLTIMSQVTGEKPVMWGSSIVGFGSYHYKYASGREGDAPAAGFSPRKESLTIYPMEGFSNQDLVSQLGPHKTSKSCLYIKRLSDVDEIVLRKLIKRSYDYILGLYPTEVQ